ncbi:MAG: CsbD family protein [Steroidobacteraceae bacterium]|nr:CsbD family protein [Deltaproteobacteria bacterium]
MKSSTKDQAEGKFHVVKGTVKEVAGKLSDNPKLEGEGAGEKVAGKAQQKIGQFKKILGK